MESLDCNECGDQFFDLKEYFLHKVLHNNLPIRTIDNKRKLKDWSDCPMCPTRSSKTGCRALYYFVSKLSHIKDFRFIFNDIYPETFPKNPSADVLLKMRSHKNTENNFQCHLCPKVLLTARNLKLHIKGVHTKRTLIDCPHCPSKFSWKYSLYAHMRKKHSLGMTSSDKKHSNQQLLEQQALASKNNLEMYYVHTAGPKTTETSKPKLIDNSKKKFQCNICNKFLSTEQSLKSHTKGVHAPRKFNYCSDCPRKFLWEASLNNHKKLYHTLDRPKDIYQCDICTKVFLTKTTLSRHKEGITNCPYCTKKFCWKSSLFNHKMIEHSGDTLSSLKDSTSIEESVDLHADVNENKTSETSNSEELLNRSKDKVQCEICNKVFISERNLIVHKVVHTKRIVLTCPHCPRKFLWEASLYTHITNKHSFGNNSSKNSISLPGGITEKHFDTSTTSITTIDTCKPKYDVNIPKTKLRCDICTKILISQTLLKINKGDKRRKTVFDCPHLGYTFFVCVTCNDVFEEKSSLIEHRNRFHNKNIPCLYCPEVFRTKNGQRNHLNTVHIEFKNFDERLRRCLVCKIRFSNKQLYEEHVERVHNVKLQNRTE